MKFLMAFLEGFGRYQNTELAFREGVNLIVGPNESGKSTLLLFLLGMLYGPYEAGKKRKYPEEEFKRLRPWDGRTPFRGRLRYQLDDGRLLELVRDFEQGTLHVIDLASGGRDVTDSFPLAENKEHQVMAQQVGLDKILFRNAAVISLREDERRTARDKGEGIFSPELAGTFASSSLALADTGSEDLSAGQALQKLRKLLVELGSERSRVRRWNELEARGADLGREREELVERHAELERVQMELDGALRRLAETGQERRERDVDLARARAAELSHRVGELRQIEQSLREVSSQLEPLAGVESFPAHMAGRLGELEVRRASLLERLERLERGMRGEREKTQEIEAYLAAHPARDFLNEEYIRELGDAVARWEAGEEEQRRLEEFLIVGREELARAEARMAEVEAKIAPFLQLLPIPQAEVELLDDRVRRLDRTEAEEGDCRRAAEGLAASQDRGRRQVELGRSVFGDLQGDFMLDQQARRVRQVELEAQHAEAMRKGDEARSAAGRFRRRALLMVIAAWVAGGSALGVLLGAASHPLLWVFLASLGVAAGGLCLRWLHWRQAFSAREEQAEEFEGQAAALEAEREETIRWLEELLERSPWESPEELARGYLAYRDQIRGLGELEVEQRELGARRQEVEARCTFLRGEIAAWYRTRDLPPPAVPWVEAVQSFLASHRQAQLLQQERENVESERNRAAGEVSRKEADLRERFEQAGRSRAVLLSAAAACHIEAEPDFTPRQVYDRVTAVWGELQGRREEGERLRRQEVRLREEEDEIRSQVDRLEQERGETLMRAGVQDEDEFRQGVACHRQYLEVKEKQLVLREKHAFLEGGRSLTLWEQDLNRLLSASAFEPGQPTPPSAGSLQEREELALEAAEAQRRAEVEVHRLQAGLDAAQRGLRRRAEVEEELELVGAELEELRFTREALLLAESVLEEVSRETHRSLAPLLQREAARLFAEVTGGRYREVLVGEDLGVRVVAPGAQTPVEPASLSQGARDQLSLVLRVSLLSLLSSDRERVPLLLDDPFSHYDGERLTRALELVDHLARERQVLLLSCHRALLGSAEERGWGRIEIS